MASVVKLLLLAMLCGGLGLAGCNKGERPQAKSPATPPPPADSLFAAIRDKNTAAVRDLLAKGADVNAIEAIGYTPVHVAAAGGQVEIIRLLLEKGAAVNAPTPDGITPLHNAAMTGDAASINLLIDKGAQVLAQDNNGMTPLHTAALKNNIATAEALVKRGADVNFMTQTQWTPLRVAEYSKAAEMVAFLKAQGAKQ